MPRPRQKPSPGTHRSLHAEPAVLQLQRTRGNRHVQRIVNQRRATSGAMPVVQPKLVFGATNDKYEREADRVAQQVTTGSAQQKADVVQPMSVAHGTVITSDVNTTYSRRVAVGKRYQSPCASRWSRRWARTSTACGCTPMRKPMRSISRCRHARLRLDETSSFGVVTVALAAAAGRGLIAHELTHVVAAGWSRHRCATCHFAH